MTRPFVLIKILLKSLKPITFFALFSVILLSFFSSDLFSQALTLDMGKEGGSFTGRMVQLVLILSVLSLAPSILVMVTSFTRIVVVFYSLTPALWGKK